MEDNPYEGHTLQSTMDRIVARSGIEPEHVYCAMSYRGHDYEGECEIHAVLSAAGMNFSKLLLAALGALWSFLVERSVALFAPRSPRGTIAATTG